MTSLPELIHNFTISYAVTLLEVSGFKPGDEWNGRTTTLETKECNSSVLKTNFKICNVTLIKETFSDVIYIVLLENSMPLLMPLI